MKKKSLGLLAGIIITLSLAACESSTDSTQITEASTVEQAEPTNAVDTNSNEIKDNADENESSELTFNMNEDFIGIQLDGYKTELTIYNKYEDILEREEYYDKAKEFVLEYIHNNGFPDLSIERIYDNTYELDDCGIKDVCSYVYITDDWKAQFGKSYRYCFYHYDGNNNNVYYIVSYDPKNDFIFIENKGLDEFQNITGLEGVWVSTDAYLGYTDTNTKAENIVDCVAEYMHFTSRFHPNLGFARIRGTEYTDPAYEDIKSLFEQYGECSEVKNDEGNILSYVYMAP